MHPNLRPDDFIEHALRAWGTTVYRLALNQTQSPHDADDVCQEVFLRLLKDPTDFKDDEHLKAWLLCVTVNCSRDLHRSAWKRRTELTGTFQDTPLEGEAAEDEGVRALYGSNVGHALSKLPATTRLIVHLFYYEGYPTEEIARLVRCLPATVRSRLRRARTQLKGLLEQEASHASDE